MPKLLPSVSFALLLLIGSCEGIQELNGPRKCRDGWRSPSIGRQGACSHHGGVAAGAWSFLIIPAFGLAVGGGVWAYRRLDRFERSKQRPQLERRDAPPIPLCQLCGTAMVSKTTRRGKYKGREYLECFRHPQCNGRRWK